LSLQNVAKVLEKQGRKGDTMLMHVNPTELQVLESLLGKTTRNPKTGLPEAFSWKTLLTGLGIGVAGILTGGAALPVLMPLAGATMLGSAFVPGSKKNSSASEAGKYLDERTAQRVKDQYQFAPPTTLLKSISEQVGDVNNPRTDLLGRQKNWYAPDSVPKMGAGIGPGYAQGGHVTEAQAKETVLGLLAKMQQQQGQVPQQMSHGRRVQGPGTGLDDSIPARLSQGEYVIPADVVSMMGDGSTEAGGQKLDELLARVRMHKTGTKKQAPALPMGKVMGRR
jgi:hypothetical protein